MSSYTAASLATSLKDQVRLSIGDTRDPFELADAEITFRLTEANDSVLNASIECVRDIIAKLSRKGGDRNAGGASANRSQKVQQYQELLDRLLSRRSEGATIHLTGVSCAETNALLDEGDHIKPSFTVGMDDYPKGYPYGD